LKSFPYRNHATKAYQSAKPFILIAAGGLWAGTVGSVLYILDALKALVLRARQEPFIFLAALATAIYAVFAYNQWHVMHDQLRIMSDQLDQMDIAQRPWIRLSKVIPVGLSVTEAGVIIDVDLHAKNIGHSPAETVYATGRTFSDMSLTQALPAARAICNEDPGKHLEFDQSMIFPDEDRDIQDNTFTIGIQEIKNRWVARITSQYPEARWKELLANPVFSSFTVIGCIIYSYRDRSASGQTAFAFDVAKSCEPDIGPFKCAFDASHPAKYRADDMLITESFVGLFAR
jgi:hypothetical protein